MTSGGLFLDSSAAAVSCIVHPGCFEERSSDNAGVEPAGFLPALAVLHP